MAWFNKSQIFTVAFLSMIVIQPPLSQAGEKLVIGHSPSITAALNIIAWKQEFFAKEGLDVELRNMESGNRGVDAMLAGDIDVAETTTFGLVSHAFKRNDFNIFTTMAVAGNDNMVIARKDRGINNIRDLKGKKVGVLKAGFPQYVLDLMLLKAGLNTKEIIIVLDDVKNLPQRISSGELDAVCVFGSWIDKTRQALGGNTKEFNDKNLLRVTVVQAAKTERITRNPSAFAKLLKAYIRAEEYVKKNPDNALKIVIEQLKLSPEDARKNWKPDLYHVGFDQALIKDMEAMAHWQIETGLQKDPAFPNFLRFIDFKPLESIDSARVKVVHKR